MEQLHRDWGERVRARRALLQMDQATLAQLVNVRQSTISRIERGENGPSDALKFRLADALGTNVREMFPYPPSVVSR